MTSTDNQQEPNFFFRPYYDDTVIQTRYMGLLWLFTSFRRAFGNRLWNNIGCLLLHVCNFRSRMFVHWVCVCFVCVCVFVHIVER